MACQVQATPGHPCGKTAIATWDWGGPTLLMCRDHDFRMKRHLRTCKECKKRLNRTDSGKV